MMQTELFSKREKEVIELLLQGKSNKQIAAALGISKSTVEYHLKNIYRKLDVVSRAEAILHLSNNRLRETTGSIDKGNLWLHIGEITSKIGYSSQAKQFFDPKEEKAMKNRTMFSIFLSVIALAIAIGVIVYLRFESMDSKSLLPTNQPIEPINTPRGGLSIPPKSSTRQFDEVLLLLQSPEPPFKYAAIFVTTGCFLSSGPCAFTEPIPFSDGESLSGSSIYWMPDGENGFYVRDNQILVLNHLERINGKSDILVPEILTPYRQIYISPDGRWLIEAVEVADPYATDLVLIKTSSGKINKLDIGLDECFKSPLGWVTPTKFMFRCEISTGETTKKNLTDLRYYTYDVISTELLEISSGMDIGFDKLSPNGEYVVYYEKQNGFRIRNLVDDQVYPSVLPNGQYVWSHDSSKIVTFTDTGEVYVSKYDGSSQQMIYSSDATGFLSLDWLPDNKHIMLVEYFDDMTEKTTIIVLSETGEILQYSQIPTIGNYNVIGISPLPAIQK
ncbi:MAG TPA: helix-turn-helix transcriptional regulator [Anaerolineales bacterium]|nr:helix-turn-helix transcriptional regulator [Anaerolineales bacterium]HNS60386.1 helix-turn-helix transcriptional regulator [Anaerolineales bacterium]